MSDAITTPTQHTLRRLLAISASLWGLLPKPIHRAEIDWKPSSTQLTKARTP
jgi:hypothetical protein